MKTRRKPRWTTSDTTRWGTLRIVEAMNEASMSKRDKNELERLERKRRGICYYSEPKHITRSLRRFFKQFIVA